jgi:hypothetical protein
LELEWTQPTLTQSILKDLKFDGEEVKGRQNERNVKAVPANTTVPVTDHNDSPDHNTKDFCEISPTPLGDQALWGLLGYLLRNLILRLTSV